MTKYPELSSLICGMVLGAIGGNIIFAIALYNILDICNIIS